VCGICGCCVDFESWWNGCLVKIVCDLSNMFDFGTLDIGGCCSVRCSFFLWLFCLVLCFWGVWGKLMAFWSGMIRVENFFVFVICMWMCILFALVELVSVLCFLIVVQSYFIGVGGRMGLVLICIGWLLEV
jgi:hypothetical protein